MIERLSLDSPSLPSGFTAMEVIGLDATITERGVALVANGDPLYINPQAGWAARIFRSAHSTRYLKAPGR